MEVKFKGLETGYSLVVYHTRPKFEAGTRQDFVLYEEKAIKRYPKSHTLHE
jgi:hypothetical protein